MLIKSRDTIGLDIGSSFLKVVQLKEKRNGYELEAFDMLPLPPELIVDGSIIDSLRLVEAVKEILKKARVKSKNCALGIAGHASVIIRRISLPEMSEEELSESIRFEAEQYVPFDLDDVNIDFQILGPKEEPGQMEVILVAVKKDIINEYLAVVRDAGLNAAVVDINSFALGNMYEINYEVEPGRNVALVNIGASTLNLNVLKGSTSIFTRDSSVGSNTHTEALQKEFDVTFENAERLKMGGAVQGVSSEEVQSVLSAASDEIAAEIARSLEYFRSAAAQEEVHEVVLSGGGALVKDFPQVLSQRVGLEVLIANPFKNVHVPGKFDVGYIEDVSCMAAVAVGLAIRRAGDR
ncbi:MAG: type IV pilus assembly protein PilM [Nitrospirota bacterium]|jgi:type IV pilus assembly protein PilM